MLSTFEFIDEFAIWDSFLCYRDEVFDIKMIKFGI